MLNVYGLPHAKFRGPTSVVSNVPQSRQYNLTTGVYTGVSFGGGDLVTKFNEESIISTNRVAQFPGRSNYCIHRANSLDYSQAGNSSVEIIDTGANVRYEYYGHHLESSQFHSTALANAFTQFGVPTGLGVLGSGSLGYINEAARRLKPELTTISMPNFLLEIRDILTIRDLLKGKHMHQSLSKEIAGGHLQYSFGLAPLMGDLQAMVAAVQTLTTRMNRFLVLCGVLLKGSTILLEDVKRANGVIEVTGPPGTGITRRCPWTGTLHRTITAHIAYKPQPLAVMENYERTLRGLLDTFGFELNPAIVWNAIPFSFVVDWFVDIGDFLEMFKIDTLELPIAYIDSYLQYKEVYAIESSTVGLANTNFVNQSSWSSGGWSTVGNLFHRVPIFPDYATLASLGWKQPSLNKAALMVSLATALRK